MAFKSLKPKSLESMIHLHEKFNLQGRYMNIRENSNHRLLRLQDVLSAFPVSRSSWYEGIKLGLYPSPARLGRRTVAWKKSDIELVISTLNPQE